MEFDIRVILIGKTGLDAKLRLDPAIELIRVRSALEAIGELSDPIEGYSAARAVVIVGTEVFGPEGHPAGEADFTLDGTGSADFAKALRLVDPEVRILRAVMPSANLVAGPSETKEPTYYDDLIDADLPAETLRDQIRRSVGVTPSSEMAAGEAPPSSEPFMAEPLPTRTSIPFPSPPQPNPPTLRRVPASAPLPEPAAPGTPARAVKPVEVLPRAQPAGAAPNSNDASDVDLVQILLKGGDVLQRALDLVRKRLGDPSIELFAQASREPGTRARVEAEGKVFGELVGARAEVLSLQAQAAWLGAWLRLAEQVGALRQAAFTDPLTGAWNRRYFERFLTAAIDRARAGRQSVTLLVFDIDNFKQYNDAYGHAAADAILIETVRLLRSVIRPSDRVCRIGGDEFAVIFHEPTGPRVPGSTPPSSVFDIATRFQEQISQQRFPKLGIEAPGTLTISGGLATFPWDGTSVADLLRRADALALESKRHGKNAITLGPPVARAEPR